MSAQTASAKTKPLHLDGTPGHGQGIGSGSGAGIWLSGTPASTTASGGGGGAPAVGRSYHISSQASRPSSQQVPTDLMLTLNSSDSGDIDLDLSFEFVSQLEKTRQQQQQQYETPVHKTADELTTEPSSPRGMSTAKWASRLKKQPPSALNMPNKKQLAVNAASHFSPISPLYHKADGEASLLVIPLGSTRRAVDAGIKSEQIEQPISRAELVQRQRMAAQMQNKERLSPEKRSSPLKKRFVLGEIKNKQTVASLEQGDVFDDSARDFKKVLKTSVSQVSNWTALNSTSFASALESQTALNVPTIAVNRAMPSENVLGLDLNGGNKAVQASSDTHYNETADESSPDTAFSPLFESDTARSASDGINTPGTTFSSLFDDRMGSLGDLKTEASTQMKRGISAPLPSTVQIVNEVIKEEESVSLRRAQSTSADSILVDLSLINDGNDHLKDQHGAISSVSDFGSSPIKGGDRPMIVNTFDSPTTEEVEFLFRKSNQLPPVDESKSMAKAGQWNQSDLLLNKLSEQDGKAASALGLGIDMGGKVADHMELDMSEISVERAILPELDAEALGLDLGMQTMPDSYFAPSKVEAGLAPSSNAKDQMTSSPSYVSSVEGFAINITPAGQAASKVIFMPTNSTPGLVTRGQSKSKWGNKMWNLNPLTSLRSPNRVSANAKKSPPMKELTLRVDMVEDGYNTVPSSATLPMTSILSPPQAFSGRARSSRHVSRSSRLRYVPNENGHVQVDMTSPDLNRVSKSAQPEAVSRFRTSSSSMTPKMEYEKSARTRRHSWGCSDTQSWIAAEPAPTSKLLEVPVARESHLYFTTLRNSTLSAVLPVEEVYRPVDTIVEDGIRRRTNHRATNSVPSTPTIIPASWATPELYEAYPEQDQYEQEVQFDNTFDDTYARQGGRRRTGAIASTIDIHGPASAIGPYLLGLTGTRNRSKMVKTTGQQQGAYYYNESRRHTQIQLFSDDREQIEGLFAFSGRALETSPSKNLFFAGFLAMPWLWFIGGWGLEDDGSIYVGRDAILAPQIAQQQANLTEDVDESLATHVSGRDSQQLMRRASMMSAGRYDRYAMGTPESIIDMEEQYAEFQRRGKAQSFIEQSTYANDDDQHMLRPNARRATSLLEGSERDSMRPLSRQELRDMASSIAIPVDMLPEEEDVAPRLHSIDIQDDQHQEGFAYSSQNEKDDFSVAHQQGGLAHPGSRWDDYDDKKDLKTKSSKKLNIFQQVKAANSHMLQLFVTASHSTHSSMSLVNIEQRRRALIRMQNHSSPDHQPVLIRAMTNWTRLETFVLWNRIMAVIVSIAVFGAAGVAIFFVVSDW